MFQNTRIDVSLWRGWSQVLNVGSGMFHWYWPVHVKAQSKMVTSWVKSTRPWPWHRTFYLCSGYQKEKHQQLIVHVTVLCVYVREGKKATASLCTLWHSSEWKWEFTHISLMTSTYTTLLFVTKDSKEAIHSLITGCSVREETTRSKTSKIMSVMTIATLLIAEELRSKRHVQNISTKI